MSSFIPVNQPLLEGNEKKYLNECINSGWISSEGRFVKLLEKKFSNYIGRKYGIAVSSGTAAIEIAFNTLNIKKDDEVIMSTFSIISCVLPLIRINAKPVLVDCDPLTWNIDHTQIEKKITKKTKAIMITHIYGLSVDVNPILKIAKKYKLKIIEDAAESHGLKYKNKFCGSFGDISIFSFYSNKLITTGEGGMILTNNKNISNKSKSLRNLCFNNKNRFKHYDLGWNYRMSNVQAAIGLAQFEKINFFIKKKILMGQFYTNNLKNLKTIQIPLIKTQYCENIYWVYGIVLKNNCKISASKAMKILAKKGIGSRPFFYPINKQPILNKYGYFKNVSCPIAEKISKNGFYIPSGLSLSKLEMKKVSDTLNEIFI